MLKEVQSTVEIHHVALTDVRITCLLLSEQRVLHREQQL